MTLILIAFLAISVAVNRAYYGGTVIRAGESMTFDSATGEVLSRNSFDVKAPSAVNDESIKGGH